MFFVVIIATFNRNLTRGSIIITVNTASEVLSERKIYSRYDRSSNHSSHGGSEEGFTCQQ